VQSLFSPGKKNTKQTDFFFKNQALVCEEQASKHPQENRIQLEVGA